MKSTLRKSVSFCRNYQAKLFSFLRQCTLSDYTMREWVVRLALVYFGLQINQLQRWLKAVQDFIDGG